MATRTTQFFYDAVGNRTKVVDPDLRTTYYTYDKDNILTGISVDPDAKSSDYYFDARGLLTTEVKPNSAVTYYEYDDAGRLSKLENVKSDDSLISSFEYDRDLAGNITKCHRGDGETIYYEYDKAQRLRRGEKIFNFFARFDPVSASQ